VSTSRRQALANTVAVGKDGFLFHRFEKTFEQVCGEPLLDEAAVSNWVSLLEARHTWCRDQGIPYLFFIVPEKHVVYQDMLPFGEISEDRPARAILRRLHPDKRADFLYPLEEMVAARAAYDTFFRTDVHWSQWGAYTGYRALAAAISRTHPLDPVPESALQISRYPMIGDLGIRLDPEPDEEAVAFKPTTPQAERVFGNRAYTVGQVEVFQTEDRTKPRAILFRDSNATSMLPYLAPHFSRLVCVACAEMYRDLIISERPDIVLTQTTERQLARPIGELRPDVLVFPADDPDKTFTGLSGIPLPLPQREEVVVISFRETGDATTYLGTGWSHQERDHVWMIADESRLTLPLPNAGIDYEIQMDLRPHVVTSVLESQHLEVFANGAKIGACALKGLGVLTCRLPAAVVGSPRLELVFRHPDGFAPITYGQPDSRPLSICVTEMRVRPAPPLPKPAAAPVLHVPALPAHAAAS
jgi:hypothetical protein